MRSTPNIISKMNLPVFLMAPPFSLNTNVKNNVWMEEMSSEELKINDKKAMKQFIDLYSFISAQALVYQLPSDTSPLLQDQVYVANLGIILSDDTNTAVISSYTSEVRRSETPVGESFFDLLGFNTIICPFMFEGEAELKHLYDNIYIGGYGMRSDIKAYEWMEENCGIKVIKVQEQDPYLYHLDCSIFPLDKENTLVYCDAFSEQEIKEIEKITNIIDIDEDGAYNGLTNSVRVNQYVLNASNINDLKAGTDDYITELKKNQMLERICAKYALQPVHFNLSEYMKSGAMLSCMIMHINRASYSVRIS